MLLLTSTGLRRNTQVMKLKYRDWSHRVLFVTPNLKDTIKHMLKLEGNPKYGKCPKISNTFLFLFSTKMLAIRAGIHKRLVRIANREDPDQTASSEAV